jgi:undecaprenyl-diphosphatase
VEGRKRGPWRWPLATAGAAVAVAAASAGARGQALDRLGFGTLNRAGGRGADRFFKAVTELGSLWASVGAAGALVARGRRRTGLEALGAAAVAWAMGQALKRVYGRPRPYQALDRFELLIGEPAGSSWPSSHPAVLMAFLTVVAEGLEPARSSRAALMGLAGLVGVSRVYLGVHYPSDVLGGLLLGRATGRTWAAMTSQGSGDPSSPPVAGRVSAP